MGRLLALDYGSKRIGVALSDPTGTIASPLDTLTRRAPEITFTFIQGSRETPTIVPTFELIP